MKSTVDVAHAPVVTEQGDGSVVRRTFRQDLGDLIKMLLMFGVVSGVIVAMSVHRYVS